MPQPTKEQIDQWAARIDEKYPDLTEEEFRAALKGMVESYAARGPRPPTEVEETFEDKAKLLDYVDKAPNKLVKLLGLYPAEYRKNPYRVNEWGEPVEERVRPGGRRLFGIEQVKEFVSAAPQGHDLRRLMAALPEEERLGAVEQALAVEAGFRTHSRTHQPKSSLHDAVADHLFRKMGGPAIQQAAEMQAYRTGDRPPSPPVEYTTALEALRADAKAIKDGEEPPSFVERGAGWLLRETKHGFKQLGATVEYGFELPNRAAEIDLPVVDASIKDGINTLSGGMFPEGSAARDILLDPLNLAAIGGMKYIDHLRKIGAMSTEGRAAMRAYAYATDPYEGLVAIGQRKPIGGLLKNIKVGKYGRASTTRPIADIQRRLIPEMWDDLNRGGILGRNVRKGAVGEVVEVRGPTEVPIIEDTAAAVREATKKAGKLKDEVEAGLANLKEEAYRRSGGIRKEVYRGYQGPEYPKPPAARLDPDDLREIRETLRGEFYEGVKKAQANRRREVLNLEPRVSDVDKRALDELESLFGPLDIAPHSPRMTWVEQQILRGDEMKRVGAQWKLGQTTKDGRFIGRRLGKVEVDYVKHLNKEMTLERFPGLAKEHVPFTRKPKKLPRESIERKRKGEVQEGVEVKKGYDLFEGQPKVSDDLLEEAAEVKAANLDDSLDAYIDSYFPGKKLDDLTEAEGGFLMSDMLMTGRQHEFRFVDDVEHFLDGVTRGEHSWGGEVFLGRTALDYVTDSARRVWMKLGTPGKRVSELMQRKMNKYLLESDYLTRNMHQIFKGVHRNTADDAYIAAFLDNHKDLAKFEQAVSSEKRVLELRLKARQLRVILDDMHRRINNMRRTHGLREMEYVDQYLTHIMTDRHVSWMARRQNLDHFSSQVFFRFAEPRSGAQAYKMSAIDAMNAYVPNALRHYHFTPVRKRWAEWRKTIPTSNRGVKNMVKYADEWVEYVTTGAGQSPLGVTPALENYIKGLGFPEEVAKRSAQVAGGFVNFSTQAIYLTTLGGNVPAAARNLTQMFNTILQFGPKAYVQGVAATFSNSSAVNAIMSKIGVKGKGLFFNRDRFLRILGVQKRGSFREPLRLSGVGTQQGAWFRAKSGRLAKSKHGLARAAGKAADIGEAALYFPFAVAEKINRRVTVMSSLFDSYEQARAYWKARGGVGKFKWSQSDAAAAIARARRDLAYLQFDFTPAGQLPMLRTWGARGLFQYARFPLQQSYLYANKLNDVVGAIPTATARQGGNVVGVAKEIAHGDIHGAAREVVGTMNKTAKLAMYMGAASGATMLGVQVGMDMGRAFPKPFLDVQRAVLDGVGVENADEYIPGGEDVVSYLPNIGPGGEMARKLLSGEEDPLAAIEPRPVRGFRKLHEVAETGEVLDWRGGFEKKADNLEPGANPWIALFTSADARRAALGARDPQLTLRHMRMSNAAEMDYERDRLREQYIKDAHTAFRRGQDELFMAVVREAIEKTQEKDGYKFPIFGISPKAGTSWKRSGKKGVSPTQEFIDKFKQYSEDLKMPIEGRRAKRLSTMVRLAFRREIAAGTKKALGR